VTEEGDALFFDEEKWKRTTRYPRASTVLHANSSLFIYCCVATVNSIPTFNPYELYAGLSESTMGLWIYIKILSSQMQIAVCGIVYRLKLSVVRSHGFWIKKLDFSGFDMALFIRCPENDT
jgi:hypothetical protein